MLSGLVNLACIVVVMVWFPYVEGMGVAYYLVWQKAGLFHCWLRINSINSINSSIKVIDS